MRVGIDAHMVGARETGNETHIVGLIEALARLPGRPDRHCREQPNLHHDRHGHGCRPGPEHGHQLQHHYRVLTPRPERLPPLGGAVSARRTLPLPGPLRLAAGLPLAARHERLDLLHCTYIAPPLGPPPLLLIHDVAYHLFPHDFSPRVRWQLRLGVSLSIRRARCVLTVSESSRRDLERLYPAAAGRCVVTPNGVHARFGPAPGSSDAAVRARHGLTNHYLLAVGDLQPRKNLPRLLDAFAMLAPLYPDLTLAIVGKAKWRGDDVVTRVRALGLTDRVRLTGYVPADDLPALYRGALALVYPSRYEGFGLPPIEAMACGAPVLTTTGGALPEVVGDAALTVPPDDTPALLAQLRRLLHDAALRSRLATAGPMQAARWSWDAAAARFEALIDELAAKSAR